MAFALNGGRPLLPLRMLSQLLVQLLVLMLRRSVYA